MAEVCPVPLINMESAMGHPRQALGDWKTIDDYRIPERGKFVLSLGQPSQGAAAGGAGGGGAHGRLPRHGDGGAAARRLRAAAGRNGQGAAGGGASGRQRDAKPPTATEALRGAQVIYAKSWSSALHYGDEAAEKALRAQSRGLVRRRSWFAGAPEGKFMHCLPVRRNVVVADEMLDGPRSIVVREAHNRMWAQMAVLYRLLKG